MRNKDVKERVVKAGEAKGGAQGRRRKSSEAVEGRREEEIVRMQVVRYIGGKNRRRYVPSHMATISLSFPSFSPTFRLSPPSVILYSVLVHLGRLVDRLTRRMRTERAVRRNERRGRRMTKRESNRGERNERAK